MTPKRIARLREVLNRRQPDLTVVTDFVHKQRNLSAIVRNCDAVGIQRMHAVIGTEDYKTFRGTAMGSHHWVDVDTHQNPAAALDALKASGYQLVAAHFDEQAADYRQVDYTLPTGILLGAERRGVSAIALERVDRCITIPMVGMVESYNVSVAAGIVLAEAQRQREAAGMYAQCRLEASSWERLFFEWGHPRVRDFCRERGLSYPPLDAEGEIDNPSGWYADVREGRAPMEDKNND